MDFNASYQRYLRLVEDALASNVFPATNDTLVQAMKYSLLAGGKRIRPVLLLAFCEACGGDVTAALPFACAVEMVHTYSLIHDDLPCMDDDDLRRGKPTNHKVFGDAMALLAGDGLLTHAFALMLTSTTIPAFNAMQAASILAQKAGIAGMVKGQVLDMEGENKALTMADITEIEALKTGALLEASCLMGCVLATATQAECDAAVVYAHAVGVAFQIKDDMLNVEGDAALLGKAVGTDAARQKATYVQLLGMDACRQRVLALNQEATQAVQALQEPLFLQEMAIWLAERQH